MTDLNKYAYDAMTGLNISDLHKDARGVRCRLDFNNGDWDKARVDAFYDTLVEEVQFSIEDDARREAAALTAYNEHLSKLMADYDLSFADAIRWDLQAEQVEGRSEQDIAMYLFNKRLGFADMDRFVKTITEMEA